MLSGQVQQKRPTCKVVYIDDEERPGWEGGRCYRNRYSKSGQLARSSTWMARRVRVRKGVFSRPTTSFLLYYQAFFITFIVVIAIVFIIIFVFLFVLDFLIFDLIMTQFIKLKYLIRLLIVVSLQSMILLNIGKLMANDCHNE